VTRTENAQKSITASTIKWQVKWQYLMSSCNNFL